MFIEWKDEKFGLGISTIDTQHRELITITNQLHNIVDRENHQKEAIRILKQLYAYTSYHFTSEEALQKEYGYPDLNGHIATHRSFKEKIKEELEGVRDKLNYPLAPIQDFLVEWILKHIKGEDVKYADYFKGRGIFPETNFSISAEKRSNVLDQWENQQLELEIKGIDDQHKELIYILQQTNDLQHTSSSRKTLYIPVIIKKLFYYSQFHFSYEEEHMAKNGYPELKAHMTLHKGFIDKIRHFASEYGQGFSELTDEIILFLKDWTIGHILQEDRKYKDFLIDKSVDR
ncbi:bacteriohemerythrin [Spirochaeta isovalerica]|uniref:Hemerythrin-like metal-binding protein n=1 Tax=Spirochaeta isovalerica TaxID=150 RepID=A0A841RA52_9SPIO|nr:bacteriohemerythrin [Spirochaeta isovalerica]MBB6479578.1 hemerythrin-like metal-binding protein [Spirochaeta isovalerica]